MNASAPTSKPRGRPRDPRTDEVILEAALRLVAEVGFDRMTIEALATRAGVGKPTIYLRWPGGKAEVVASAIMARRNALDGAADLDTGNLRGDLCALVRFFVERMTRDAPLAAGLTCQLRESPELARVFRDHAVEQERERTRALLRRAAARGEVADAAAVTPLFPDVAPSLIYTRVLLAGEPVDAAFVDTLVDDVLLPILTPSAEGPA
jgi:AcrR family transcriptional regulator